MAKEWGVGIVHNGYSNQYKIECEGLSVLNLNKDYTMLHWLIILLESRHLRGWNFWDMKPQIAENGIRRNLS